MNKKIKFGILIILIFSIITLLFIPKNYSKAKDKDELFFDIVDKTNSSIVEVGAKVTFSTKLQNEEFSKEICSYLNLNKDFNKSLSDENGNYNIYFYNKEISGNINIKKYNNENIVMIDFKSATLNKRFTDLKNNVKAYLNLNNKKDYVFEYLKAENNNKNLKKINNDIKSILDQNSAKNIETIELDNGYSTTAYTKRYTPINVCGKKIDFNYAICKYNSQKTYLILGTPQIDLTY
ncbi:YwmB family TATA-box binding protein [Clostridium tepidum]|uniref:YwmB family TATA-box binding protein n=1 Tax=Clostridium tepidum TaxID=1962263 RepID=UPI0018AA96C8|nr:YwmB family TATA-box binding protein [Clostridium tepidum]